MTRLKGASLEAIADAVEQAVAEEEWPILAEIDRQAAEYHEARPDDLHGFGEWLLLLQAGGATLPDRLPRAVLLAWRDSYKPHWGLAGKPWVPMPFWRCVDCLMVLPHGEAGWGRRCPVCGGGRIWHSDFSKALGVAWIDPNASYGRGEV
jgi:predicted RNA-binding Zn-ribbon protein involved in translation (DUF1610 family)